LKTLIVWLVNIEHYPNEKKHAVKIGVSKETFVTNACWFIYF